MEIKYIIIYINKLAFLKTFKLYFERIFKYINVNYR